MKTLISCGHVRLGGESSPPIPPIQWAKQQKSTFWSYVLENGEGVKFAEMSSISRCLSPPYLVNYILDTAVLQKLKRALECSNFSANYHLFPEIHVVPRT